MAKLSGGSRKLTTGSREYIRRVQEIDQLRSSGKYSSVEMGSGGGYVAIEKSPMKHKPEEIEAAYILADKGYKVTLIDESGVGKTPDGFLFSLSFEQRTPHINRAENIRNALFHARNKGAEVAVIYSIDQAFSRESLEQGLLLYEAAHAYRFRQIIVVSNSGTIHRHQHNDT